MWFGKTSPLGDIDLGTRAGGSTEQCGLNNAIISNQDCTKLIINKEYYCDCNGLCGHRG